jgi:tRNA(adenine34) deaminase
VEQQDAVWMREALTLAHAAEQQGEVPVGAIVVCDGEIIGRGWNRNISDHDPSAHAEIVALRAAGRSRANHRLPGCTLYVTLEPCHARLDAVVYGAKDPKTGALGGAYSLPAAHAHNHALQVRGGVLQDEAAELLRDFFRARR